MKLLASVDSTTRGQAILQRTVESLSVIVITYYLAGLGSYIFKALYEVGWLKNATFATAIFIPVAFGLSLTLMGVGRKVILRRMSLCSMKAVKNTMATMHRMGAKRPSRRDCCRADFGVIYRRRHG